MFLKFSDLCLGFVYVNPDHADIFLHCLFDQEFGDLEVFATKQCDNFPFEHLFHDSVNLHEDDIKSYLDDLSDRLSECEQVLPEDWFLREKELDNKELLSE